MKFSDKLANLRKNNNLSQEQLADKLGVSRQSVSKWELGDTYPDMAKLIQMCEILNCTLPDLMDDGTFDESFSKPKEKNNIFSSYMHNFLDYITKAYNMFIHMRFKEKLVCLIEMLCIFLLFVIVTKVAPQIIEIIFDRVFRYIPYGRNITDIIVDICTAIIIILEVIAFFHLFKIRYLDYYVTVIDNTIDEQIIEEPIEENKKETAFDEKHRKEKIIIRDPKHSISHFLDGLGKVLFVFFKIFIVFCAIPAVIIALGGTYLAIIMISNVAFSSLFAYGFIVMFAIAMIGFELIYMALNYLFKRNQPYRIIIIIFITCLLTIGVGCGLATNKALQLKVVDKDYHSNDPYNQEVIEISDKEIGPDYILEFSTYYQNIVVETNEEIDGIRVIIDKPEYVSVYTDKWLETVDYDNDTKVLNGRFFTFSSNLSMSEIFLDIKEDIKNGQFRRTYDNPSDLIKVKLIMPKDIKERINIRTW